MAGGRRTAAAHHRAGNTDVTPSLPTRWGRLVVWLRRLGRGRRYFFSGGCPVPHHDGTDELLRAMRIRHRYRRAPEKQKHYCNAQSAARHRVKQPQYRRSAAELHARRVAAARRASIEMGAPSLTTAGSPATAPPVTSPPPAHPASPVQAAPVMRTSVRRHGRPRGRPHASGPPPAHAQPGGAPAPTAAASSNSAGSSSTGTAGSSGDTGDADMLGVASDVPVARLPIPRSSSSQGVLYMCIGNATHAVTVSVVLQHQGMAGSSSVLQSLILAMAGLHSAGRIPVNRIHHALDELDYSLHAGGEELGDTDFIVVGTDVTASDATLAAGDITSDSARARTDVLFFPCMKAYRVHNTAATAARTSMAQQAPQELTCLGDVTARVQLHHGGVTATRRGDVVLFMETARNAGKANVFLRVALCLSDNALQDQLNRVLVVGRVADVDRDGECLPPTSKHAMEAVASIAARALTLEPTDVAIATNLLPVFQLNKNLRFCRTMPRHCSAGLTRQPVHLLALLTRNKLGNVDLTQLTMQAVAANKEEVHHASAAGSGKTAPPVKQSAAASTKSSATKAKKAVPTAAGTSRMKRGMYDMGTSQETARCASVLPSPIGSAMGLYEAVCSATDAHSFFSAMLTPVIDAAIAYVLTQCRPGGAYNSVVHAINTLGANAFLVDDSKGSASMQEVARHIGDALQAGLSSVDAPGDSDARNASVYHRVVIDMFLAARRTLAPASSEVSNDSGDTTSQASERTQQGPAPVKHTRRMHADGADSARHDPDVDAMDITADGLEQPVARTSHGHALLKPIPSFGVSTSDASMDDMDEDDEYLPDEPQAALAAAAPVRASGRLQAVAATTAVATAWQPLEFTTEQRRVADAPSRVATDQLLRSLSTAAVGFNGGDPLEYVSHCVKHLHSNNFNLLAGKVGALYYTNAIRTVRGSREQAIQRLLMALALAPLRLHNLADDAAHGDGVSHEMADSPVIDLADSRYKRRARVSTLPSRAASVVQVARLTVLKAMHKRWLPLLLGARPDKLAADDDAESDDASACSDGESACSDGSENVDSDSSSDSGDDSDQDEASFARAVRCDVLRAAGRPREATAISTLLLSSITCVGKIVEVITAKQNMPYVRAHKGCRPVNAAVDAYHSLFELDDIPPGQHRDRWRAHVQTVRDVSAQHIGEALLCSLGLGSGFDGYNAITASARDAKAETQAQLRGVRSSSAPPASRPAPGAVTSAPVPRKRARSPSPHAPPPAAATFIPPPSPLQQQAAGGTSVKNHPYYILHTALFIERCYQLADMISAHSAATVVADAHNARVAAAIETAAAAAAPVAAGSSSATGCTAAVTSSDAKMRDDQTVAALRAGQAAVVAVYDRWTATATEAPRGLTMHELAFLCACLATCMGTIKDAHAQERDGWGHILQSLNDLNRTLSMANRGAASVVQLRSVLLAMLIAVKGNDTALSAVQSRLGTTHETAAPSSRHAFSHARAFVFNDLFDRVTSQPAHTDTHADIIPWYRGTHAQDPLLTPQEEVDVMLDHPQWHSQYERMCAWVDRVSISLTRTPGTVATALSHRAASHQSALETARVAKNGSVTSCQLRQCAVSLRAQLVASAAASPATCDQKQKPGLLHLIAATERHAASPAAPSARPLSLTMRELYALASSTAGVASDVAINSGASGSSSASGRARRPLPPSLVRLQAVLLDASTGTASFNALADSLQEVLDSLHGVDVLSGEIRARLGITCNAAGPAGSAAAAGSSKPGVAARSRLLQSMLRACTPPPSAADSGAPVWPPSRPSSRCVAWDAHAAAHVEAAVPSVGSNLVFAYDELAVRVAGASSASVLANSNDPAVVATLAGDASLEHLRRHVRIGPAAARRARGVTQSYMSHTRSVIVPGSTTRKVFKSGADAFEADEPSTSTSKARASSFTSTSKARASSASSSITTASSTSSPTTSASSFTSSASSSSSSSSSLPSPTPPVRTARHARGSAVRRRRVTLPTNKPTRALALSIYEMTVVVQSAWPNGNKGGYSAAIKKLHSSFSTGVNSPPSVADIENYYSGQTRFQSLTRAGVPAHIAALMCTDDHTYRVWLWLYMPTEASACFEINHPEFKRRRKSLAKECHPASITTAHALATGCSDALDAWHTALAVAFYSQDALGPPFVPPGAGRVALPTDMSNVDNFLAVVEAYRPPRWHDRPRRHLFPRVILNRGSARLMFKSPKPFAAVRTGHTPTTWKGGADGAAAASPHAHATLNNAVVAAAREHAASLFPESAQMCVGADVRLEVNLNQHMLRREGGTVESKAARTALFNAVAKSVMGILQPVEGGSLQVALAGTFAQIIADQVFVLSGPPAGTRNVRTAGVPLNATLDTLSFLVHASDEASFVTWVAPQIQLLQTAASSHVHGAHTVRPSIVSASLDCASSHLMSHNIHDWLLVLPDAPAATTTASVDADAESMDVDSDATPASHTRTLRLRFHVSETASLSVLASSLSTDSRTGCYVTRTPDSGADHAVRWVVHTPASMFSYQRSQVAAIATATAMVAAAAPAPVSAAPVDAPILAITTCPSFLSPLRILHVVERALQSCRGGARSDRNTAVVQAMSALFQTCAWVASHASSFKKHDWLHKACLPQLHAALAAPLADAGRAEAALVECCRALASAAGVYAAWTDVNTAPRAWWREIVLIAVDVMTVSLNGCYDVTATQLQWAGAAATVTRDAQDELAHARAAAPRHRGGMAASSAAASGDATSLCKLLRAMCSAYHIDPHILFIACAPSPAAAMLSLAAAYGLQAHMVATDTGSTNFLWSTAVRIDGQGLDTSPLLHPDTGSPARGAQHPGNCRRAAAFHEAAGVARGVQASHRFTGGALTQLRGSKLVQEARARLLATPPPAPTASLHAQKQAWHAAMLHVYASEGMPAVDRQREHAAIARGAAVLLMTSSVAYEEKQLRRTRLWAARKEAHAYTLLLQSYYGLKGVSGVPLPPRDGDGPIDLVQALGGMPILVFGDGMNRGKGAQSFRTHSGVQHSSAAKLYKSLERFHALVFFIDEHRTSTVCPACHSHCPGVKLPRASRSGPDTRTFHTNVCSRRACGVTYNHDAVGVRNIVRLCDNVLRGHSLLGRVAGAADASSGIARPADLSHAAVFPGMWQPRQRTGAKQQSRR